MKNGVLETFKTATREQALIIVEREKSKRSLYQYFLYVMQYCYPHIEFEDNWHYEVTCDILQDAFEKVLRHESVDQHLLINMPTRSLKTVLVSEIAPSWLWIRNAGLQVQNVCATQRLATKSSRMSKLIIESQWYRSRFPEVELSIDQSSKMDYATTKNGSRSSFGIGTSSIGTGFDVQIIDDPNDPADSNSEAALRRVRETFTDVLTGRANNDWSLRIVMQQRTSHKDLCGYLLENNPSDYRHLCITGELSPNTSEEFRKYYVNGLFFPSRYSREILNKFKSERSAQAYASQIQQQPSSVEGEIIRKSWIPIVKLSEYQKLQKPRLYLFIDTAYTKSEKDNDPHGFLLCAVDNNRIYVLRAYEKWLEFHEALLEIQELLKTYNIHRIYVEAKATGISVMQELRRQLRGKVAVLSCDPKGRSKEERARASQPYLINGQLVAVEGDWNPAFLDQLAAFPYGKHDSHIDTSCYAIEKLIRGKNYNPNQETPQNVPKGQIQEPTDDIMDNLY